MDECDIKTTVNNDDQGHVAKGCFNNFSLDKEEMHMSTCWCNNTNKKIKNKIKKINNLENCVSVASSSGWSRTEMCGLTSRGRASSLLKIKTKSETLVSRPTQEAIPVPGSKCRHGESRSDVKDQRTVAENADTRVARTHADEFMTLFLFHEPFK